MQQSDFGLTSIGSLRCTSHIKRAAESVRSMSSFRISEVDEEAREELLKLRRSGLEENEIKEDYERGR